MKKSKPDSYRWAGKLTDSYRWAGKFCYLPSFLPTRSHHPHRPLETYTPVSPGHLLTLISWVVDPLDTRKHSSLDFGSGSWWPQSVRQPSSWRFEDSDSVEGVSLLFLPVMTASGRLELQGRPATETQQRGWAPRAPQACFDCVSMSSLSCGYCGFGMRSFEDDCKYPTPIPTEKPGPRKTAKANWN